MNKAYTRSKTVKTIDNKIYYWMKNDGQLDVMTYSEDLYKILTDRRLSPFRDADGRLRFTLYVDGIPYHKYRVHDISFGCYQGLVHYDTFIEDMQKYLNSKVGLSIDHVDSNFHNNTINNLSLMDSELNRAKGAITARVKFPNRIICAYVDGRYRIEFVNVATAEIINKLDIMVKQAFTGTGLNVRIDRSRNELSGERFICNTAEDFVDCLKWCITRNAEWADTIKPQRGKYINSQNKCYSDDLGTAIKEQERLAATPVGAFQILKH